MSGESRGARWVRRRGAAVGPRVSRRWKAQGPWGGCGGGGSRRPRDAKWRNSIYISNPSCNVLPLTPLIFSLSDSFILSISLSLSLSFFSLSSASLLEASSPPIKERENECGFLQPPRPSTTTPVRQYDQPPPLFFSTSITTTISQRRCWRLPWIFHPPLMLILSHLSRPCSSPRHFFPFS